MGRIPRRALYSDEVNEISAAAPARRARKIGIPKRALFSDEVNKIAKEIQIKGYLGCFGDNDFPDLMNKECCIVNYESNYQTGSHYTAIYRSDGNLYHFDSLGFLVDEPIVKYAKKNKLTLITSDQRLQQDESFWCGHYCLLFLSFACNNYIDDFYELFDLSETPTALKANDSKVFSYLKSQLYI